LPEFWRLLHLSGSCAANFVTESESEGAAAATGATGMPSGLHSHTLAGVLATIYFVLRHTHNFTYFSFQIILLHLLRFSFNKHEEQRHDNAKNYVNMRCYAEFITSRNTFFNS